MIKRNVEKLNLDEKKSEIERCDKTIKLFEISLKNYQEDIEKLRKKEEALEKELGLIREYKEELIK